MTDCQYFELEVVLYQKVQFEINKTEMKYVAICLLSLLVSALDIKSIKEFSDQLEPTKICLISKDDDTDVLVFQSQALGIPTYHFTNQLDFQDHCELQGNIDVFEAEELKSFDIWIKNMVAQCTAHSIGNRFLSFHSS